ncbi:MAG: hypothetical protein GY859_34110, partial [Desulfobacterales bacterium]|nr:hypothetical protein [Desulfobacterales bacterium]
MVSPLTTITIVIAFGAAMFAASAYKRRSGGVDKFLVADRSVGAIVGAVSIASTWIWAPALFIAAQKAYQQGLPGLMWFTAPNIGCLILFAFLARKIRAVFPEGYTLPQYISQKFGMKPHALYIFTFLSLQVCSLAVQLIAGASMLNAISGIPYAVGVLTLVFIFTSYSLLDGLKTSIRTDLFQLLLMGVGLLVIVPFALKQGGGFSAVKAGLAGFNGKFGNPFDPTVAYTFGITVTIGLMSGPVGDQQHWQRAFAFKPGKAFKGYVLGALIFALFPLALSLLGFLAAGAPETAPGVRDQLIPAQQVGPEVIRTLLPGWGLYVFMVLILCGLASTGDSALCAGGALVTIDIFQKYVRRNATGDELLRVSRLAIVGMAVAAAGIALIPGVTILSLFLFYGTLRSSTFMPTLMILFGKRVNSTGLFWGVALAIAFGLPLYLTGAVYGVVHLKVGANIGILLISSILPIFFGKYISDKKQKK